MLITNRTKINDLLKKYPFLEDFLVSYNPKFKLLKSPPFRMTIGKTATLKKISKIGQIPIERLMDEIKKEIESKTDETVSLDYHSTKSDKEKMEKLKTIIRELHSSENVEAAKKKFDDLITDIDHDEIVEMEEELIREGMPVTEIQRLCDLHMNVVRNGLIETALNDLPQWHPVIHYIQENREAKKSAEKLNKLVLDLNSLKDQKESDSLYSAISSELDQLRSIDKHYLRKENQLFPYLEKKGIEGPPQVMWGVHDEIRKSLKSLNELVEKKDIIRLSQLIVKTTRDIIEMIAKEERILFPMALQVLTEDEWRSISESENEIGFAFSDRVLERSGKADSPESESGDGNGEIPLNTGALKPEQINLMLLTMPVDMTFVDENDNVRYYTGSKDRIFSRTPEVIGRNVERCHPPKSVHIVKRILAELKAGKKDIAEFWLQLDGKFLHIRYFAIRDKNGKYVGCLEFMQDITEIKKLEGERRLLSWEE